jgi:peptidyl-prolyl cis-trans isomerase SurA
MKNVVLIFVLLVYSNAFFGQTLVRYGNKTISRDEFLRAFRKNNTNIKISEKAYREYLNLYIRYRLKVQAALDLKLDTLPGQITELLNFKSQIADQYTNDESSLNQMAEEAFIRSQQDLRISYIFVALPKNASPTDTAKAWKKIQDAYQVLKSGKDFGETAIAFSDDPNVKVNKGDIGFITVFDLPYTMETVAYHMANKKGASRRSNLPYSPVFRMDGGYVILKKTDERPGEGRIRIAQILVAFPYQAGDAAKEQTRQRADSIYRTIAMGADFGELARKFSGDNLSYQLGGVLPEFGIGKYEPGYEQTAFNLKKDGDVSEPYGSGFGYHIIKRISRKPVPAKADQKILEELKDKIKSDPRISVSRKQMLQTILKQTKFRDFLPAGNMLWNYTDSMLSNKKPAPGSTISEQAVLFQIADKKYSVGDWITYRKSLKSVPNLTNGKTNAEIMEVYRQAIAFQYYKVHLEKYNAAYAAQVYEFRDGNLLFEIMQQQIWNRASADSAGLKKYFEANSKKYWWKPGAEAIIFTTTDMLAARKLGKSLVNNMDNWRKIVDSLGAQVQADSGRFEWKQIPGNGSTGQDGRFTEYISSILQNNTVPSVQFAFIIRKYPVSSSRTFEEARGLAINDYQTELENRWIERLEKKYPVTISETVFKTLPK